MNCDVLKLAIMQPYFFPYSGYFSLIKATNKWIVFDTSQHANYSWMNRNRILNFNNDSWMYFRVLVKKHPLKTPINHIEIQNDKNWKEKIISQLGCYKKYAPHYKTVVEFLVETLKTEFENLSALNVHTLKATCDYIGIDFNYEVFSEMDIQVEPVHEADEWGLNICKAMGVTEYINAERGQLFIDREKYRNNNINIKFLEFGFPEYNQKKEAFIPGLSIIDAMMFNSPLEINQMLDEYQLVN